MNNKSAVKYIPLFLCLFFCCHDSRNQNLPGNNSWILKDGALFFNGLPVLSSLPPGVRIEEGRNGIFLLLTKDDSEKGIQYWRGIGLEDESRLLCGRRFSSCMQWPELVSSETDIPAETQFMLWKQSGGRLFLCLPLIADGYRCTLYGEEGGLSIIADNNCSGGEKSSELRVAYLAGGSDPYDLIDNSYREVVPELGLGTLRKDKPEPDWVDYLGWCTWYAHYTGINHNNVAGGIKAISDHGIRLGYLLLDDGWQDVSKNFLAGFGADEKKFPFGLKEFVERLKAEYEIKYFFVWHTIQGYWPGIDSSSSVMKPYSTYSLQGDLYRPEWKRMIDFRPDSWRINAWFNVPDTSSVFEFYDDYHSRLASMGVDGVKIDNQGGLANSTFDLAELPFVSRAYIRAMENSVTKYFGPSRLMHSMCMSTDLLYQYNVSSVARCAEDFNPHRTETQGPQLYHAAYNTLFAGPLVIPNWCPFVSGIPMGEFHAVGRVVSGGPVCDSGSPDSLDYGILQKLALSDGRILRCKDPGLPTADILFRDPSKEDVLLKVFNRNRDDAFVLGAWNCRYLPEHNGPVEDSLRVSLIHGCSPEKKYVVYAFRGGTLARRGGNDSWRISLAPGEWELYTVTAIDRGIAPIGHLEMYNSGGIFWNAGWADESCYRTELKAGGKIGLYSERSPARILCDGSEIDFEYSSASGMLSCMVNSDAATEMEIFFD